jgi:hypothetical protein
MTYVLRFSEKEIGPKAPRIKVRDERCLAHGPLDGWAAKFAPGPFLVLFYLLIMCNPKVRRLVFFFLHHFKWILARNGICSMQLSIKNCLAMIYIRSPGIWILKVPLEVNVFL